MDRVGLFNPWGVESVEKVDLVYEDINYVFTLDDFVPLTNGSEADDHASVTSSVAASKSSAAASKSSAAVSAAVAKSLADRPWTEVVIGTTTRADGGILVVMGGSQVDAAPSTASSAQSSSASTLAPRQLGATAPAPTSTAASRVRAIIPGATRV